MKEKVIAIDIGGVCLDVDFRRCLLQLGYSGSQAVPEEFMLACGKFECGLLDEKEWLDDFRSVTGGRFSDDELLSAWNSIIGDDIPGMADAVREITGRGFRFVFFSDTSTVHIMEVYRKLSFANLISGGIFSFDAGALKPSVKMYEAFERSYGEPCFYIDDKKGNIEGGIKRGWESRMFISPRQFLQDFLETVVCEV